MILMILQVSKPWSLAAEPPQHWSSISENVTAQALICIVTSIITIAVPIIITTIVIMIIIIIIMQSLNQSSKTYLSMKLCG